MRKKVFYKITITIFFTFLLSSGYAQRKEYKIGYWKDTPKENAKKITPSTIKEKLSGTAWYCYDRDEYCVKNGVLTGAKFIFHSGIEDERLGGTFIKPVAIGEEDEIKYRYPYGDVLYIGDNEMTRYKYNYHISKSHNEKSATSHSDNIILFLDSKERRLYLCTSGYRTDGKLFYVDIFYPCGIERIEWAEIHYCIMTTHFTILDRVEYPPVKITDIICTAPQNPNKRAELPFPDVKPKRHRRTMW